MEEKIILSAFGTLKEGFHNHSLLQGADHIGTGVTKEKYLMTTVDKTPIEAMNINGTSIQNFRKADLTLTPFPYVLERFNKHYIRVELYLVSQSILKLCDRLEGVPYFYYRKTVEVIVNERIHQADMYFYNEQSQL